jgi:hypothetical protein
LGTIRDPFPAHRYLRFQKRLSQITLAQGVQGLAALGLSGYIHMAQNGSALYSLADGTSASNSPPLQNAFGSVVVGNIVVFMDGTRVMARFLP